MENLKVKISSEAESKEVQDLFFELGYEKGVCSTGGYPALIIATPESRFQKTPYSSRATSLNHEAHSQYKEITLPELRDLVVLKRNSIDDATHTDGHYSFYVGKDKNYFFSSCYKAWRGTWKNVDILKPIEKPMKEPKQAEFLVKTDSGYVLQVLDENAGGEDVVRIPDGAVKAYLNNSKTINFVNADDDYMNSVTDGKWVDTHRGKHDLCGHILVWKRETLNDQVASAEEYREMISNADIFGRVSVVTDIAQSCSGGAIRNASSQGHSDFLLNNSELNHCVAKAFNAVRGTNLNEDDIDYIRELINLTVSHYGERK